VTKKTMLVGVGMVLLLANKSLILRGVWWDGFVYTYKAFPAFFLWFDCYFRGDLAWVECIIGSLKITLALLLG
jgi:hypothetical protein